MAGDSVREDGLSRLHVDHPTSQSFWLNAM
jgi:hypothetical protein